MKRSTEEIAELLKSMEEPELTPREALIQLLLDTGATEESAEISADNLLKVRKRAREEND